MMIGWSCSSVPLFPWMVISNVPVGVMTFMVWTATSPLFSDPQPVGLLISTVLCAGMFPVRLRLTEPVNPLRHVVVTKYGAPLPCFTFREGGFVPGSPSTIIWKSGVAEALTPGAAAAAVGAGVTTSIVPTASSREGSTNSCRSRMNQPPLCPHVAVARRIGRGERSADQYDRQIVRSLA